MTTHDSPSGPERTGRNSSRSLTSSIIIETNIHGVNFQRLRYKFGPKKVGRRVGLSKEAKNLGLIDDQQFLRLAIRQESDPIGYIKGMTLSSTCRMACHHFLGANAVNLRAVLDCGVWIGVLRASPKLRSLARDDLHRVTYRNDLAPHSTYN